MTTTTTHDPRLSQRRCTRSLTGSGYPPAAFRYLGRRKEVEQVTAIVIVLVVVGTLVGLGFAFGGPALAVLLILAALVVLGWLLVLAFSKRTPTDVARRAEEQEFFGPGGPDDPNR
jgi:hypothetical protein